MGPLGCLLHIGKRGLLCSLRVEKLLFYFWNHKKESCGVYLNQISKDLKLTFSQSDDAELHNRVDANTFLYISFFSLLQVFLNESLPSVQACISIVLYSQRPQVQRRASDSV